MIIEREQFRAKIRLSIRQSDFFYLWGQAPKLSAGVRPRDKVSFRNLLLGPGPKVKF